MEDIVDRLLDLSSREHAAVVEMRLEAAREIRSLRRHRDQLADRWEAAAATIDQLQEGRSE